MVAADLLRMNTKSLMEPLIFWHSLHATALLYGKIRYNLSLGRNFPIMMGKTCLNIIKKSAGETNRFLP